MLKSRQVFPIGGWQFFQPQTGFNTNPHNGFDSAVKEIIAHRRANPRFNLPTDIATVERELEAYTEARLLKIPGGDAFLIPNSSPPAGSFPFPPLPRRVAGGASSVETSGEGTRVKAGVSVIAEWLGKGLKPASVELATKRASICAGCKLNQPATGMQILTGLAAKTVGALMDAKSDLKLVTPYDDKLETCQGCLCHLKLKIWSPLDIVWKHMDTETIEKLDPACWQILEKRS